ncbi:MAG TPA: ABC transporter substrate-binding protein, partial [Candidatus Limnocylindria bacterium]
MHTKRLAAAGFAMVVALAACSAPGTTSEPGGSGNESAPPAADQVLRIPLGGEPATLDPNRASDSVSITVLNQLVRPLVYFDPDLNTVSQGGLAESWDVSEDGQTITFHLQDGIKYSDGSDIVAADFVTSWKRLIDPRTAADYYYVMLDVAGASDVAGADPDDDAAVDAALENFGVEAPDDQTFVVHLSHPASYFVSIATLWVTAPIRSEFEFGEADGYVSSGPFVMTEWNHEENITLDPNPEWTSGPTTGIQLEMPIIADPAQTLAAYENDEVDIAAVPSADVQRIRDDPDLSQQVIQGDRLSLEYY